MSNLQEDHIKPFTVTYYSAGGERIASNSEILEKTQSQYKYVFVDEYQDINRIQNALLKLLVQKDVRLTAIGDPQQAIYGFRGSDVSFFRSFPDDFQL